VSKYRVFGGNWDLLTEGHFDTLEAKAVEGIFVRDNNDLSMTGYKLGIY